MTARGRKANSGFGTRLLKLFRSIELVLCRLHQIQFDAPWRPRQSGC